MHVQTKDCLFSKNQKLENLPSRSNKSPAGWIHLSPESKYARIQIPYIWFGSGGVGGLLDRCSMLVTKFCRLTSQLLILSPNLPKAKISL